MWSPFFVKENGMWTLGIILTDKNVNISKLSIYCPQILTFYPSYFYKLRSEWEVTLNPVCQRAFHPISLHFLINILLLTVSNTLDKSKLLTTLTFLMSIFSIQYSCKEKRAVTVLTPFWYAYCMWCHRPCSSTKSSLALKSCCNYKGCLENN